MRKGAKKAGVNNVVGLNLYLYTISINFYRSAFIFLSQRGYIRLFHMLRMMRVKTGLKSTLSKTGFRLFKVDICKKIVQKNVQL